MITDPYNKGSRPIVELVKDVRAAREETGSRHGVHLWNAQFS